MWIQNISLDNLRAGVHYEAGPNSMLIQIVDPAMEFPVPKYQFKDVRQFEFLDIEEKDTEYDVECQCSSDQAQQLVDALKHALDSRMNVIVHCVAGLCRSGAVAEVGVMLGFEDTETQRTPNLLVKHRMLKALGLHFDPNEPYTLNGKVFKYNEFGLMIPEE
jgi:predicted protein tyrosine phosphatase